MILTKRQFEIAELIDKGMTSQQIAKRLKLSRNTVAIHRGNIRRKLGVNTGESAWLEIHEIVKNIRGRL